MTTSEAAAILGLRQESVSRLINKGILRGVRFASVWQVYADSVEAYRLQNEGKAKRDKNRGKKLTSN